MAIRLAAAWQADDISLDPRVVPLLRQMAKLGSLNRAVAALGLTYRHAWGLLGKSERDLGRRLVIMERGRGARLSTFGERLLAADEAAAAVLARELANALGALNSTAPAPQPRARPLVVHASHDLALAELRDLMSQAKGATLDLHFRGSLDCLAALARGECELAGFHLPESSAGRAALDPYRPLLATRSLRLIRFVRRRQGLMVARGNPMRLSTIAALAEKGARFVNRQPESGTRLCFDRLLAAARLRPAQIRGYAVEEFTHAAVAATVASGMADASFGIEAAARQHGLDFVPLADESYFLAVRAATLARAGTRAVLEEMRGPAFLKRLTALPGYDASGIGDVISVRERLGED